MEKIALGWMAVIAMTCDSMSLTMLVVTLVLTLGILFIALVLGEISTAKKEGNEDCSD